MLMLSTFAYELAVDLRKAHGINVAIEPILIQILRTLEGFHRGGMKLICAVSPVRAGWSAVNGGDRQQKHRPGENDSAIA